jgi:MFS family permease
MQATEIKTINFKQFCFLTVSTVFSLLSFSIFMTLEVLELDRLKLSALENGLITSIFFFVIIAINPFIQKIVKLFAHRHLYIFCKIFSAFCFLFVIANNSAYSWAICSFILGLSGAILWPITEACIAELAPENSKGKYTGIYQTALGVSFAIGPFIVSAFGNKISSLMIFCFLISSISTLAIYRFPWHMLSMAEDFTKLDFDSGKHLRQLVPVLIICSFIGGFYENGMNGLSILIGKAVGFNDIFATLLPGIIGVGSFLAQYPIGIWADRHKASNVLLISLLSLAFFTALLPLGFVEKHILWPLALIWGAVGGAMYTLSLVIISRHVDKKYTVQFTGLMIAAYTIGCAVSPSVGGFFFDLSPIYGLAISFTLIIIISLFVVLYYLKRFRDF